MTKRLTLLYKAFDDVTTTIRALDAKASYILVIVIFLGGAYYGLIKDICDEKNPLSYVNYVPLALLVVSILLYIHALQPRINPVNILHQDDIDFVKNNFFILNGGNRVASNDIFPLKENAIEDIAKIISIEILKLSYIRDIKIKWINRGITTTQVFIVLATVMFIWDLYKKHTL